MRMAETKNRRQEVGMEGEKQWEETIKSAIQVLSTVSNEFSNPPTQSMKIKSSASDNGGEYSHLFEMSGGAHYKSSFTYIISLLSKAKPYEMSSTTNSSLSTLNEDAVEKLEERASTLREELANKNKYIKVLMDQTGKVHVLYEGSGGILECLYKF